MISVVIVTSNEEKNIKRAIESVKWADEIIVCDMHSEDETAKIAKTMGAKVFLQKPEKYVELVRNASTDKATNEWVLILDPDEEIPESLAKKIIELINNPATSNFVEMPRKNIIFGKWVKNSMWWPDYNIRLFKKGSVLWGDKIHRPPETKGESIKLPAEEHCAILHHHYDNISQYIQRLDRYTDAQSEDLIKEDYVFNWKDLISKPVSEFLNRYFANRGFEDGLHGLVLSLLQSFSFVILYLKIWEKEKFKEQEIKLSDFKTESKKVGSEFKYWFITSNLSKNTFKRILQKIGNKIS